MQGVYQNTTGLLGEMEIRLKSEVPTYHKFYRFTISERELDLDKIQTLKEGGVIRDSNLAYVISIVLIAKKEEDL